MFSAEPVRRYDPGIERQRIETRQRLDRLAMLLDAAIPIPGTQLTVGLDFLLGLFPGVGDALSAALSSYIIYEARKLGLPWHAIARMIANVAFDTAVGSIPVIGDAFDIAFRANVRNMRILRQYLGDAPRPKTIDAQGWRQL